MNFVAPISQVDAVKAAVPDVLAMTSFEGGNRYQDFAPSVDRVAAVKPGCSCWDCSCSKSSSSCCWRLSTGSSPS